jgi:chemotaxis protein histidine kinase CheA
MSAQIQDVLQKMRLAYVTNLPQKLDTMETLVLELNKGEDYDCSYENLYRAIHSLKGTAGTYGVAIITTICQSFEDHLTATHEDGAGDSDQQINTCLRFIDLLRVVHKQVAAGRNSFPEIEVSLAAI